MGLPKLLTTDQGKEFRNSLYKEMTELLGIKKHFATCTLSFSGITYTVLNYIIHAISHAPLLRQMAYIDERWNQTLKKMIAKYVNEKKEDCDVYIDCHVFAYNTAKHASSLYSPFEVMFGRKANIAF